LAGEPINFVEFEGLDPKNAKKNTVFLQKQVMLVFKINSLFQPIFYKKKKKLLSFTFDKLRVMPRNPKIMLNSLPPTLTE